MTGIKHKHPNKHPMKAIILSAGQGRRLLTLTENTPKCLLPVLGKPINEWQIDALLTAGVDQISVATGYQSAHVETLLQQRYPQRYTNGQVNTIFNPFFEAADNLA